MLSKRSSQNASRIMHQLFATLCTDSDTMAVADGIAADPFGTVIFAGEVPGIGTKVANTIDKELHGVVFVDYNDFEKEFA
jgi:hypothetical protein